MILLIIVLAYLLGLFTDELLGPGPRVSLMRWRRQIARRVRDDPVHATFRICARLRDAASEDPARERILAALSETGVTDYTLAGDDVMATIHQGQTTMELRISPLAASEEPGVAGPEPRFVPAPSERSRAEVQTAAGPPAAPGTNAAGRPGDVRDAAVAGGSEGRSDAVMIVAFRLSIECALRYRDVDETVADVEAVLGKLTTALARQQIVPDPGSKVMSVAVSVLPELGISTLADMRSVASLREAMAFSARVRNGGAATVVLRDHRVEIEGELDSTTRQIIRDAVLFGSENRMVRVYPGDTRGPSGPHGSPSGPHGSSSEPHGSPSEPHGSPSGPHGSPSGPHGSSSGPHGSPSGPHGEHAEMSAKLDR
jgi:hypothetical protein